ncbi:hypothetical protein ZWY2020_032459 [Hordeum vulgare]|nr:hypothetical protein ZWY2020_032459 [Hordeum vulgare]
MGKAARWLRSLLGGGKKEQGKEQRRPATAPHGDRKRWSFCKSTRDSAEAEAAAAAAAAVSGNAAIARAAEAAWLKSLYNETEREQSKHAIAVAAATAMAADAAVAAAQAAVEVVRLTSKGPTSTVLAGAVAEPRGRASAAVKIQTAFRGFLAKKALRALKGLVKLQALVRGYLVRKQAAATLQSMQALVRAQACIRAARSRAAALPTNLRVHPTPIRPRYSLQERYSAEDSRSDHGVAPYYSRRLSASVESSSCYGCGYGYDRSPKIVEMDTGRPKSRSSSLRTTSPGASEECYANSVSSPLMPCRAPPRIAAPTARHLPEYEWCEKARPATAQSTPRYASYAPVTPTKSVCGGYTYSNSPSTLNCPSYMSSTRSSVAKVRSQSAPKQRPEEGAVRKRVPLSEVIVLQEARASLGGGGTQRSCNRPAQEEAFSFKKAVVSRFDRSSEAAERERERDRDLFLQKGW